MQNIDRARHFKVLSLHLQDYWGISRMRLLYKPLDMGVGAGHISIANDLPSFRLVQSQLGRRLCSGLGRRSTDGRFMLEKPESSATLLSIFRVMPNNPSLRGEHPEFV